MPKDTATDANQGTSANNKSFESWIWNATCSICGTKDTDKALRRNLKQLNL